MQIFIWNTAAVSWAQCINLRLHKIQGNHGCLLDVLNTNCATIENVLTSTVGLFKKNEGNKKSWEVLLEKYILGKYILGNNYVAHLSKLEVMITQFIHWEI